MKNFLFLIAFFITWQMTAQDDEGYIMYQTIELTPKAGHFNEFMDGLKAHNSKYHTEGAETVNVWQIESGPRSGSVVWVKGPLTWTDYDTPMTDDHMDDWMKNIDPHSDMGEWGHWRRSSTLTYTPEDYAPNVMRVRYFEIMDQKGNNAREVFGELIEVYKEHNMDVGVSVYYNQAPSGDGKEWGIVWGYPNWAAFDVDRDLWDKYEEKYDQDSREFFEQWREAAKFKGGEIRTLMKAVSAAGNDN